MTDIEFEMELAKFEAEQEIEREAYSIIDELREERQRQQISTRALASKSGLSKTTIVNIEQKNNSPRLDIIERVAAALDCTIHLVPNDA